MARIRSIHPSLWTDEEFVSLTMPARLFYIGLWNEADDCGLFAWKPTRLKMRLFPADEVNPRVLMEELTSNRFLVRLMRGGDEYGAVKNFRRFQRPQRPSPPIIPIDREIAAIVGLENIEKYPPAPTTITESSASAHGKSVPMEDGGGGVEDGEGGSEVPNGTPGASAPGPTMAATLWRSAVAYLGSCGIAEQKARAMLGRWKKDHGNDAAISAVLAAEAYGVSEPIPWIQARFNNGGKPRQHGRSGIGERRTGQLAAALGAFGGGGGRDGVWDADPGGGGDDRDGENHASGDRLPHAAGIR